MSNVLITGGSGLLGPYLAEAAVPLGKVLTTARHKADIACDLTDGANVRKLIADVAPAIVFHCAAFTDVDACEKEPDLADRVNHQAVANLVDALGGTVTLAMISTDQVYPDKPGPHEEGQEGPVNVYGRSKLAGEAAALRHPGALVLRVNFFGRSRAAGRDSLSDWLVQNLQDENQITLFSDSQFSPLHLTTLAQLVVTCVDKGLTGVFNLGCRGGATKADFGLRVARHLGLQTGTASTGQATGKAGRAARPADLRMDVTKIENALGIAMPALDEEIAKL